MRRRRPIQPALLDIREHDIQTPVERLVSRQPAQNVGPPVVHAGRARPVIQRTAARPREAAQPAPLALVAGDEPRHVWIASEHFVAALADEDDGDAALLRRLRDEVHRQARGIADRLVLLPHELRHAGADSRRR